MNPEEKWGEAGECKDCGKQFDGFKLKENGTLDFFHCPYCGSKNIIHHAKALEERTRKTGLSMYEETNMDKRLVKWSLRWAFLLSIGLSLLVPWLFTMVGWWGICYMIIPILLLVIVLYLEDVWRDT